MAGKNTKLTFKCAVKHGGCGQSFKTDDYETTDNPDRPWHPWDHKATCFCGKSANVAPWIIASWKPASEEGLKRRSEANKNRPKASYEISRLNALTHGAYSETAKYYPARPGKYPICEGCEWIYEGCGREFKHCQKRTELFMQFHIAQEAGDGRMLGKLMASTQAGSMAIVGDMIRSIAARGVEIESPVLMNVIDKDGKGELKQAIYMDEDGNVKQQVKVEANPLLYPLIAFISKNNMTLSDLALTPKAHEDEKRFQGFLDADSANREQVDDALQLQRDQMKTLQQMITGGQNEIAGAKVIEGETINPNEKE